MKYFIISLLLIIPFLTGCENDDETTIFLYNAKVIGVGIDCGDTYLIEITDREENAEIPLGTYYALGLDNSFKIENLQIELNCKFSNESELVACTDLGAAYPQITIEEVIAK